MAGSQIIWEDRWGEIIDRPELDLIEIRWFDTTTELDGETFNHWLRRFADAVEEARRSNVLTDAVVFGMAIEQMDGKWRDANIIPRYNASGVQRFAFIMPKGMAAVGRPPEPEGPAEFPTAYFARRSDAVAWLTGADESTG